MRIIPISQLVVAVTARKIERGGLRRWRGHWSICPGEEYQQNSVVAEGDTDLQSSEENAYLFAGTEGVAIAKEIAARISPLPHEA